MVCLGLGVAVALTLLLSSVRQLLLIQAEDMMHKLVLLARLDHPTPEKHTQKHTHNMVWSVSSGSVKRLTINHLSILKERL